MIKTGKIIIVINALNSPGSPLSGRMVGFYSLVL